ncbi:hypothetical protein OKJ48_09540 [Streptomyces kunmingensis]|uniref:Regulatory protein n=1 Tax=Streptomyces kunmingensis TaxID=68225 RepID=A0ABU6C6Z8_9ACTN|nr:hypothetical protein [Streptomyces kunmingensis]MEB3960487.1 hypothetical protein [Streptomyces kunmingensis]
MSETKSNGTELTSQYIARISDDLERNTKDRERIGAEIEALQEQLQALRHDHTVLVSMQQALDSPGSPADSGTAVAASVTRHEAVEPKRGRPTKTASVSAGPAAPRKPATVVSSAKASQTAGRPSLVDLVRSYLQQQNEPRSAAEITSALTQAQPGRTIKTTVMRTTAEGLVAKGQVQRTKQGSSVFYTAVATPQTAEVESQSKAAVGQ